MLLLFPVSTPLLLPPLEAALVPLAPLCCELAAVLVVRGIVKGLRVTLYVDAVNGFPGSHTRIRSSGSLLIMPNPIFPSRTPGSMYPTAATLDQYRMLRA